MKSKWKWVWLPPAAIAAISLFIALGGEVVMQLWNWLLPSLFGWRQITFWQAIGMLALCRILFGGWGGHGHNPSGFRRRMAERRSAMTPEELDRFRRGMRLRCGFDPAASESKSQ